MNLEITNYDPAVLKADLIAYYKKNPQFKDFDYEGSIINTVVDNLVRNTYYTAYTANMVATESFLDSAQIRANVVSHAQKLSYRPKSKVAATMRIDMKIITREFNESIPSIVVPKNTTFVKKVFDVTYRFVTTSDYVGVRDQDGNYIVKNVDIKHGTLITEKFTYQGVDIVLRNEHIDTSTVSVVGQAPSSNIIREYREPFNIIDVDAKQNNYFLYENTQGTFTIQFGKNILGAEPKMNDIITVQYVATPDDLGNKIDDVACISIVGGYSNIETYTVVPAYGGSDRPDMETIRFVAPKLYKAQQRAVTTSDYEAIVLELFPFIKSCKVWSGDENVPPFYGVVFASCVPHDGYGIPYNVKMDIVEQMKRYQVSTIRLQLEDPKITKLNLSLDLIYNPNNTALTWLQIQSRTAAVITKYETENLNKFDGWFNASDFICQVSKSPVDSVELTAKLSQELPIVEDLSTAYDFAFYNEIEPGSVTSGDLTDIKLDATQTKAHIKDDSLGNMIMVVERANAPTIVREVGKVNYQTGVVRTIVSFIQGDTFNLHVTPTNQNIYTKHNTILSIDKINIRKEA